MSDKFSTPKQSLQPSTQRSRQRVTPEKNNIKAVSKLQAIGASIREVINNVRTDALALNKRLKKKCPEATDIQTQLDCGERLMEQYDIILKSELKAKGSLHYADKRIQSCPDDISDMFDLVEKPPEPMSSTSTSSSTLKRPNNTTQSVAKRTKKEPNIKPKNGDKFEVIEVMELYESIERGHKRETLMEWIDSEYIPVQKSKFHYLLNIYMEYKDGGCLDEKLKEQLVWPPKTHGRRCLFTLKELQSVGLGHMHGNNFNMKAFEEALNERKKELGEKSGILGDLIDRVCSRTLKNYRTLLVRMKRFNYQESAVFKSETRFQGENSVLSCISYLMTLATTHYLVTPTDEGEEINKSIPNIKNATKGAQLLYDLVQDCNKGMSISPVDPNLTFSTDDSTVYTFRGKEVKLDDWYIIETGANTNTKSVNCCDEKLSAHLNGIRTRLTFTMSAAGNLAPIFITVYGLSEEEVPFKDENGLCVIEVPGLAVGGNIDVNNKSPGYISFLTSKTDEDERSMDQRNFEYYRDYIFLPWLEKLRESLMEDDDDSDGDNVSEDVNGVQQTSTEGTDNVTEDVDDAQQSSTEGTDKDPSPNTEVPSRMSAVSWTDGGITQLKAIMRTARMLWESALKIVSNKHARGCSAIQQPCDVSAAFRVIKKMLKHLCQDDFPENSNKRHIRKLFKKLFKDGKVKLDSKKKEAALVDLCLTLPFILTRGVNSIVIRKGFIETGMVDEKTYHYPDLFAILKTCNNKEVLKTYMVQKIINDFPVLYEKQMKEGMLTDEFLIGLGYPADRNTKGEEVVRKITSKAEWNHRAKTMSNAFQISIRDNLVKVRTRNEEEEKAKLIEFQMSMLSLNNEAEELMLSYLPQDAEKEGPTRFGTLEKSCLYKRPMLVKLLQAFIFVRQHDSIDDSSKVLDLNKGKKTDDDTANTLVNVAYGLRLQPPKLKMPEPEKEIISPDGVVNVTDDLVDDEIDTQLETEGCNAHLPQVGDNDDINEATI